MTTRSRNLNKDRQGICRYYALALVTASLLVLLTFAVDSGAEAARFMYYLGYPESGGQTLDPGSVTYDIHTGELFITDARNQRIVIFDKFGRYAFDFSDPEHLSGLRQVSVDSQGRIYVLRSGPVEQISVFDYNGEFLNDLPLSSVGISGMVMDERDQLYVLSVMPARVRVYSTTGEQRHDFALFSNLDSTTRYQPAYGTMALVNNKLVIPIPIMSAVARYTTGGEYVDLFGMSGGGPGELSFPVAAAGDREGKIWVLDKHRHSLLQFDDNGKYVRELGGRGHSPGWFYHPTSLACNAQGEAIVAQTYMGRVQAIALAGPADNDDIYTKADPDNQK